MALLFSNTFDEAIAWLTETTGEAWSERRVLQEIIAHEELTLEFVPPRDAQFAVYRYDAKRKCPPGKDPWEWVDEGGGPFVRLGLLAEYPRLPLRVTFVIDLLEHREAHIVRVNIPDKEEGPDGRWVDYVLPMSGQPLRVTLSMCRVPYLVARRIAAYCITARTPASGGTATPDEEPTAAQKEMSESAANLSNAPPVSADPATSIDGGRNKPAETLKERDRRIAARYDELRAKKSRNFNQVLANEEDLSVTSIKNIIRCQRKQNSKEACHPGQNSVFELAGKKHSMK